MPTGEIIFLAIFAIPILAALLIVRREGRQGANRVRRPFWVTFGIGIVIAMPLALAAGAILTALNGPR